MAKVPAADALAHLASRQLHPKPQWVAAAIPGLPANAPIPAQRQTILFRLLATDITTTLAPPANTVFPADVLNAKIQSRHIVGPLVVQVLDVEDIGHSRWSQVEEIEAKERGETTKGREIVRIVPGEVNPNEQADPSASTTSGPHKLLLQDAKGTKVYALELKSIDGINTSMHIGIKLVLRNITVARGVCLLEPGCVQIVGGKIEPLDKAWKEGRKVRLMESANGGSEAGRDGA